MMASEVFGLSKLGRRETGATRRDEQIPLLLSELLIRPQRRLSWILVFVIARSAQASGTGCGLDAACILLGLGAAATSYWPATKQAHADPG